MNEAILKLLASCPGIIAPLDASEFSAQVDEGAMQEIKDLTVTIGKEFGIDPDWLMAIILEESSGRRYQIRYEPNYQRYYEPVRFSKLLKITIQTEIQSQKISWGLGQIIGALAREQGHLGYMAELIDPTLNIRQMCLWIQRLRKYSTVQNDLFSMYNGGPGALKKKDPLTGRYYNQSYVDDVNRNLKQLKKGSL